MGSVNFSGLGTGIDWQLLVEAQIQARRAQVIIPIQGWKTSWETKISAFDQLRSLLSDLQGVADTMDTPAELRSYQAQSNDEAAIAASVSGSAMPGSYAVEVNQLADAEVEIHAGLDEAATVVNNSGGSLVFAYNYAGTDVSVTVADGTTLQELADLINNDPTNPGVTAYVLDDGGSGATSHHLVLQGRDTGADYAIIINSAGTTLEGDCGVLTSDASGGSSSVTVDDASSFQQYQAIIVNDDDSPAEYHVVDSVVANTLNLKGTLGANFTVAQNAYATPRGIGSGLAAAATSGTSEVTVDDATHFQVGKSVIVADGTNYEELTISAVDTASNTVTFSTTLSNSYAADGYVTQLEGGRKFTFEAADFTESQTAQNAQLRVDGYPPTGWIERQTNVINDIIQGVTLTLKDDTGGSSVTITVGEDPEAVKQKIQEFVDAYNAVKTYLNAKTDYDAETEQAGVLLGNYAAQLVESLLREIVINAAPGFEDGTDPYTLLGQIGIETTAAGEGSDLGTLTIDETKLDDALTDDFEAVIKLFAANFQGYSDSSYLTFYQASELLTTPGTYDVEADFDAGGNLTGGRMKLTSESAFRSADVDPPYLVGTSGNLEDSLWVKALWDGSSSTQSAVVRVTQGVAGRIGDVLEGILDTTDGLLHNLDESYQGIVEQIDDRIEQEEERLELLRERLTAKYARLEQLMTQLQGTQSWITDMAASMKSLNES